MANHGQLALLTNTQATAIRSASALKVCELVKIYWPSPTGAKVYAWWRPDLDSVYATPLATWLGSTPLIAAFAADDASQPFHEIPRTSTIGDDVVSMRFSNVNRDFETLCYTHRGGVKVEIFYFFPEIDGGTAISWWLGHLRTPERISPAWVEVTAATGFRSNNLPLPKRQHAQNCGFYFGGELSSGDIAAIGSPPCPYDRHIGGSTGTLNNATPWTSCPHTKEGCQVRLGDTLSYGGDDTVVESTLIGAGVHKTVSTTVGNETRLKDPKRVIYGTRHVRELFLLAYAKELNPSQSHQDKGTLRTLFEIGEGPIQDITNVRVMDTVPQGLILKYGELRQTPTIFSPNVLNYSSTAHFQANLNPIDPRGIQASQIVAECDVVGRNTVRIYTDATTFYEDYSNLRAWCFLDLLTNQWYGYGLDRGRYKIEDFLYLAGKAGTFNCDVQGRSAQQQIYDICLAGLWYLPFHHNGLIRLMPIEALDTGAGDIPTFTDTGSSRNILFDDEGQSRLTVAYKDDDVIPNSITLTFEDAAHDNIERPLVFEDYQQQYRAGKVWNDFTKRKVDQTFAAYGITNLDEAVKLGTFLLNAGPFGFGGIQNNCEVELAVSAVDPDALDLHENKVIKIVSDKLTGYTDPDGNPFQYFIIKKMVRTPGLDLLLTCQAFFQNQPTICGLTNFTQMLRSVSTGPGNIRKTTGDNNCSTNASGTGDGGGRTVAYISSGDWELSWTLDSNPEGRSFVGITSNSTYNADFTTWDFCIHVSDQLNTINGYPAHSIFVYVGAPPSVAQSLGTYVVGDKLKIRREGGVVTFWHGDTLLYTHTTPYNTYPVYGAVSMACLHKVLNNMRLCPLSAQSEGNTGGSTGTGTAAASAGALIDRLISDEQIQAGILGLNWGAAPADANAWGAAELWVDRGGGYAKIASTEAQALVGTAATVLAGTNTGSETVRVDLQEGQILPSFTSGQVTAGSGFVYLGGEIFQYQTATQISSSAPNRWELSVLSNRGARCTTSKMGTHATSEAFMALDGQTAFVAIPASEIGQTRNYKIATAGQSLAAVTAVSLTFNAPNFKPTTPADYGISFDASQNQLVHSWTPISDPCLVVTGLVYEIWSDASGSPGSLLWSGSANQWRQSVTSGGTQTYYLRAKALYANGSYVSKSITFTLTPGTGYGLSGYGNSYGQ